MSYLTSHSLEWDQDILPEREVLEELHALMNEGSLGDTEDIVIYGERTRWYDSQEHLEELSRNHTGILFTMDCTGEDGEKWVEYHQDGNSYTAHYTRPEFNPGLLRKSSGTKG